MFTYVAAMATALTILISPTASAESSRQISPERPAQWGTDTKIDRAVVQAPRIGTTVAITEPEQLVYLTKEQQAGLRRALLKSVRILG